MPPSISDTDRQVTAMRIIVDLQVCQAEIPLSAEGRTTLAMVQEMARLAPALGHHLCVAFHNCHPAHTEALQHTFNGILPRSRLLMFDLPPPAGLDNRRYRAICELIRDGALALHAPDVVFIPDFDIVAPAAQAIGIDSSEFDSVLGLRNAQIFFNAKIDDATSHERPTAEQKKETAENAGDDADDKLRIRRQHLIARSNSILVLTSTEAMRGAACAALPNATVRAVGTEDTAAKVLHTLNEYWQARPTDMSHVTPRPRLAYVTPLPPIPSGIADYGAQLLPELAQFYVIDVIVDQARYDRLWTVPGITVRELDWFNEHAGEFDRIIYNFGNSPFHQHMFGLLERYPGIVVLHEFFLGNTLDYLECSGYKQHIFLRALFVSHGYRALIDFKTQGRSETRWKYPCNKAILDHACGIIVHSQLARQLANDWYGPDMARNWHTIALLRDDRHAISRSAGRAALELNEDDFVVASFGMLGQTKLNDRLLQAWLHSPLAADPHCRLVFVGAQDGTEYSAQLLRNIAKHDTGAHIRSTGFVSAANYQAWLAAADCAVQLRSNSRGETSAAVLDCLMAGLACIGNDHGTVRELRGDVMLKLPDTFSEEQLIAALRRLRDDGPFRTELAARGRRLIQTMHKPQQVGRQYREAIEFFAKSRPALRYHRQIDALSKAAGPQATPLQLLEIAAAMSSNALPSAQRRMFIDISAVVQADIKTGIQRVVRSIIEAFLKAPPPAYRIEPVYTGGGNHPYKYARRFMLEMTACADLGLPPDLSTDEPIDAKPGDIFLGLDLLTTYTRENQRILENMHLHGTKIFFVVFDILPLLRPDVFPIGAPEFFKSWLKTISHVSDGLICISRAVADEVHAWLTQRPISRAAPLKINYFHLGADIAASRPSTGIPSKAEVILQQIKRRPTLLSVGTIEPRKGYAQALDAFELLWSRAVDINYVIVGKDGWMVDGLVNRLKNHAQSGKRLFWLAGASDEMLEVLYRSSSALLASSEGEGFGLPLVEAAQHGLPLLVRELPVFREIASQHAFYFNGLKPCELADAIETWLNLHQAGKAPHSHGLQWLSWAESAAQLYATMTQQDCYLSVSGSGEMP